MEAGSLSASRTRQKYYVSEQWAMTVLPTIHIYKEILDNVPVEHILMFGTTFVEAVTMFYGAEKVKEPFILYMQTQNIELTRSIAAAYYYEPLHTKALELYSHVIIAGLKKKKRAYEAGRISSADGDYSLSNWKICKSSGFAGACLEFNQRYGYIWHIR